MIYLGRFFAGDAVFYGANFHSDQGALEDPTSPAARLMNPAGTWSNLPAPTKQDGKTGFYGGTIDTTGFTTGQYIVRMSGTVSTGKAVATVFSFFVGVIRAVDGSGNAIAPAATALSNATWTDIKASYLDTAVSTRSTLSAQNVWEYATRTLTGFGSLVSDIWSAVTRSLTDKADFALSAASRAAVVDEVWDEARAGHGTAGTFGQGVASVQGNVTGSVASVTGDVGITQAGADKVWASASRTLSSFGTLIGDIWGYVTRSLTDKADFALSAASRAAVADSVWDEQISEHLGAGSTGAALNAAGSSGDPWSTPLPGAYGSGTAGNIVGNRLDTPVSTRPTLAQIEASATLAKQAKLDTLHDTRIPGVIQPQTGDSFARLGTPSGASLSADIAAIGAKTQNLPASPAATGDPMALTASERLTLADAILGRTLAAESYAADGAVPTLSQILYMLWSAIGDFSISGTTITCRKLDGTTTSMTFSLDSATDPTSRTRTT